MANEIGTELKKYYEQHAKEIMEELKRECSSVVREALMYRLVSLSNTIKLIEEEEKTIQDGQIDR